MNLIIALEAPYSWLEETIKEQISPYFSDVKVEIVENALVALSQEDAKIVVMPLQDCTYQHPAGIVISALSERRSAALTLAIRQSSVQEDGILGMPNQAKVAVSDALIGEQLRAVFPNIEIQIEKNMVNCWNTDAYDAYVIAENYLPFVNTEIFNLYPLQVSEFIPPVGQGVLAWLCFADDLTTRRLLKNIHHSATAKKTNVERGIQRQWLKEGVEGLVYCEQDSLDFYHLHSVKFNENEGLMKEKKSSSTLASWLSFA
jgi:porphobilinogen deaminase